MRRFTNVSIAISGAVLLALAFGSPVAAATLIKQSGVHGDWGTRSSSDGPESNCNYAAANSMGASNLTSIKVFPVLAGHSPMLLQQKVSWTVSIQKHPFSGAGTWKTIATSPTQTANTRNQTSSPFSAITVSFTGKLDWKYRAVSTVHWLINGSSTGMVKFSMDTYGLKFGSAPVTIIGDHSCGGVVLD